MPDRRTHRGPHPDDARLFGSESLGALRRAAADLAWLLDAGYPAESSLKLVGDRHRLVARQRTAVARSTCSVTQREARLARRIAPTELRGRPLWIDGYNVLTTIEAALAGGVVLSARDGVYRDMASMHGTYRKVAETRPALERIGRTLARLEPSECVWYLDEPVSNSGRLRAFILEIAQAGRRPWRVELVPDPDKLLIHSARRTPGDATVIASTVVATADSAVLDQCGPWLNLARETVESSVPEAEVTALFPPGQDRRLAYGQDPAKGGEEKGRGRHR